MELTAFVTNLGKYNEGELVGKWVTFPIDEDEERELMKDIGCVYEDEEGEWHNERYEEIFITDYDCDFNAKSLGEYISIEELNDIAERIEKFDEYLFEAIQDEYCSDVWDAIEAYESECYIWWPKCTLLEVADELAHEEMYSMGFDDNQIRWIERYFNYETYIDYLGDCGYIEHRNGVLLME